MRPLLMLALCLVMSVALFANDFSTAKQHIFLGSQTITPSFNTQSKHQLNSSPGISIVQGMDNTHFDFQSNGGDERHVWVKPDGSVHAVYSGHTPNKNERNSFYVYSTDFGERFSAPARVETKPAEFPALDVTPDGRAVIVSHKASDPRSLYFQIDFQKGMGFFLPTDIPDDPPNYALARVAVTSDEMAVFSAYSRLGTNSIWNAFNFKSNTFLHKQHKEIFPGVNGSYGYTHALAKSQGGKVAMAMVNYLAWGGDDWGRENDFGENGIIIRESLDGGLTFDDPIEITNYGNDMSGTCNHVWLKGLSAIYVGEELHLTWVESSFSDVANIPKDGLKIVHWAPSANDGIPTVAARWNSDYFAHWQGDPDIAPMDFPHIGADEDGVLSIVFCAFPPDTTVKDSATGYLYSDIFAVSSKDNGNWWGYPVNLTNSPTMDDRFPYISEWNEAGKINVLYQTDTKTGSVFQGSEFVGNVDYLFLKTDHPEVATPSFEDEHFWQTVTQMQTPRFFCSATEVDGKIYVIGGSQSSSVIAFSSVGTNEMYDPATNSWTTLAPMPTPRSDHAACCYDGKIYVIGGHAAHGENTLAFVEVYDPATDTWAQKSDMKIARHGHAAFVYNNKIHTIGGTTHEADSIEVNGKMATYDPVTDQWTEQDTPNLVKYDFACCVVDDKLVVSGGIQDTAEPGSLCDKTFIYNFKYQTFQQLRKMPNKRCYLTGAFLNDVVYVIGGSTKSYPTPEAQSFVDIYLPEQDAWVEGKELPSSRYGHASCVVHDRIYVFGGKTIVDGNNEWNTDVDVYTETVISTVKEHADMFPTEFELYPNFPNPFNPSTQIKFDCPAASFVSLKIFDLLGRQVKILVNEKRPAGRYAEMWDATNNINNPVSSGIYLAVLQASSHQQSIKLVLMK
jgi:N-acetylneuraminic acid mutarotase